MSQFINEQEALDEAEQQRHDHAIALAARQFYKSHTWWNCYHDGRMPTEHWQEYLDLRDAILDGKSPRLAPRLSWRALLGRWIAGF